MRIIIIGLIILFPIVKNQTKAQVTDVFGNRVPAKSNSNAIKVKTNQNHKDEQGRKQGYWERRYSNGKPAYTVTFKDDKPLGILTRYYFNGNKKVVIDYDENQYGKAESFSEKGVLAAKGFYKETLKDSVWQFFSPEGKLYTVETYNEGKKNGVTYHYFSKGNVAEEIEWKDDVKDGIWKKYHENGQLKLTSTHKNGKIEGEYMVYFPNGKIEVQGKFENGLEEGTWLVYNTRGLVDYKIKYKAGKTMNTDEFDKKQRKLFEEFEKNKGSLKDPEQFKHDPDQYMRVL